MSQNPYDLEFNRLTAQVEALDIKIRESLKVYELFDPAKKPALEQAVSTAQQEHAEMRSRIETYAGLQQKLAEELEKAEAAFEAKKWSIKGWLDGSNSKRSRAREESKGKAVDQYRDLYHAYEQEKLARQNVTGCQQGLQVALEHYAKHDAYSQELAEYEKDREELVSCLNKVRGPKAALDKELRPVVSDLTTVLAEMNALRRDIANAEQLVLTLNNATSGTEKWQIHNKSEALFNDGTPSRVLIARRGKLQKCGRDHDKLRKRLDSIVLRHTMKIESIVIDGSNLCYTREKWISTVVVVAVANHLAEKCPVSVIFDASIRQKLGMGHDEIRAPFSDKVKVHVVATKTKADYLILKEAAGTNSWVISNDRFVEFMTEPAVLERRFIRHEITDETVYIELLDLQLSLGSDGIFS